MTDEEIMKGLECCNGKDNSCKTCPLWKMLSAKCVEILLENALDLIKTQETVIEGWKDAFNNLDKIARPSIEYVEDEKAEAIKAFAKYLIDKSENGVISVSDIPDLVTEMTEVKDND